MKNIRLFLLLIISHLPFSILRSQNPWTQKASLPAEGRHGACSFSIGERVYFGTGHNNGGNVDVLFDDWWEYDPGTNSWTQKANFAAGPRKWARAFSVGGNGYLGTGEDYSLNELYDFWKYSPVTNSWTNIAGLPGLAREGACSFTIGNTGYFGTGDWLTDMWAYDPSSNSWTQIADFPDATICASGFSIGNKAYMGIGVDANYQPSTEWYEYDPSLNYWTQKSFLPGIPRSGAIGFSVAGKGYIACGTDWPNSMTTYSDCFEYNPGNDTWKRIQDFPGAPRRFVVSASTSTRGYTCTGTNGINLNDMWEFNPAWATGIDEGKVKISCTVYPNPMHEMTTIKIDDFRSAVYDFALFDLSGKKVKTQSIHNPQTIIQRNELEAGIYFYEISAAGKKLVSGKLIIE